MARKFLRLTLLMLLVGLGTAHAEPQLALLLPSRGGPPSSGPPPGFTCNFLGPQADGTCIAQGSSQTIGPDRFGTTWTYAGTNCLKANGSDFSCNPIAIALDTCAGDCASLTPMWEFQVGPYQTWASQANNIQIASPAAHLMGNIFINCGPSPCASPPTGTGWSSIGALVGNAAAGDHLFVPSHPSNIPWYKDGADFTANNLTLTCAANSGFGGSTAEFVGVIAAAAVSTGGTVNGCEIAWITEASGIRIVTGHNGFTVTNSYIHDITGTGILAGGGNGTVTVTNNRLVHNGDFSTDGQDHNAYFGDSYNPSGIHDVLIFTGNKAVNVTHFGHDLKNRFATATITNNQFGCDDSEVGVSQCVPSSTVDLPCAGGNVTLSNNTIEANTPSSNSVYLVSWGVEMSSQGNTPGFLETCYYVRGSITPGTNQITGVPFDPATRGAYVGASIWGPGIPIGTTITAMTSNSVTLSATTTATHFGGYPFGVTPAEPNLVMNNNLLINDQSATDIGHIGGYGNGENVLNEIASITNSEIVNCCSTTMVAGLGFSFGAGNTTFASRAAASTAPANFLPSAPAGPCDSLCQLFAGHPAGFKADLTNGQTSFVNGINPAGRYNCATFDYNGPGCGAAFVSDADVAAAMTTNNGVPGGYTGFSTGTCGWGSSAGTPWVRCYHAGGGHFNPGDAGGTGDGAIFQQDLEAVASALLTSQPIPDFTVRVESPRFKSSIVPDTSPRPSWSSQNSDSGHPGGVQLWYETNKNDCGAVIAGVCQSNSGSVSFGGSGGMHTGQGVVFIQGTSAFALSGYKIWDRLEGTGGNGIVFDALTGLRYIPAGFFYTTGSIATGGVAGCPDGSLLSVDNGGTTFRYASPESAFTPASFGFASAVGSNGIAYGEDQCIPDPASPGGIMYVTISGLQASPNSGQNIAEIHGIPGFPAPGTQSNFASISSQIQLFAGGGRVSFSGLCYDHEAANLYITDGNRFFPVNMHGQPHNAPAWTIDDDPLTISGSTTQLLDPSGAHGDNFFDNCTIVPGNRPGGGGVKIGVIIGHGQVLAERLN